MEKHQVVFRVAVLSLLGLVLLWPARARRAGDPPADAAAIEQRVRALVDALDAPAYRAAITWDAHIERCYQLAHGRAPDLVEVALLRDFRDELGLSRGEALFMVVRGEAPALTWDGCREFVGSVELADFSAESRVRGRARVPAAPAGALDPPPNSPGGPGAPPLPYVRYETYFGYLHAHSELSDGEGSALEAYTWARDQAGLDFFGLTDHGELLAIWPWENKWDELLDAAHATHSPGNFVTLWGFEWSHPLLGHINVLNTEDYTHALAEDGLLKIYDWIVDRPEAFGRFNHPGRQDDVGTEFQHMAPYPPVTQQMIGIEVWNKDRGFDTFFYGGGWSGNDSYWDEGNAAGWMLGCVGGQDNHSEDWGTRNDFRTAVLATELTRPAIVDAYRQRRFYATEDADLFLDVRCRGYPMGARLPAGSRTFVVTAWDGSGDTFDEVRLYRDGSLVQAVPVSGNETWQILHDPAPTGAHYYYVAVRQTDDGDGNGRPDEALSSPIWIE